VLSTIPLVGCPLLGNYFTGVRATVCELPLVLNWGLPVEWWLIITLDDIKADEPHEIRKFVEVLKAIPWVNDYFIDVSISDELVAIEEPRREFVDCVGDPGPGASFVVVDP
jgi:hypothetical protein